MRTAFLLCLGAGAVIAVTAGCGGTSTDPTDSATRPATRAPSPPAVTMTIADGAELTGAVPWQVMVEPVGTDVVQEVQFRIDGTTRWVEREPPYFFDDDEQLLPPWLLGAGDHELTAHVLMGAGGSAEVTADVHVSVAAPAVGRLAGTYHRVVTKADQARVTSYRVPAKGAFGDVTPTGRWTMTVKPTGEIIGVDPTGDTDAAFVEPFTVDGSTVTLYGPAVWRQRDPENPSKFCEPEGPATYTWSRSGSTLTIGTQQEVCADRDILMVGTWQRD